MDDFEKSLNHVLVDTFNFILKYEEISIKKITDVPITITEAHMIEAIGNRENEETTVSDIALMLSISMPTVTVAVKKLETKGFITKTTCAKDGRRILIGLTEKGKRIERAHRLFHTGMVRNISRQLPEDEKEVLFKAVNKLNTFFKDLLKA